jgi:MFS family permease
MATSERTAPAETAELSGESWLALFALLAGAFLGTLDTTVVNIALDTIRDDFGVSVEQVQLVGSGYILAFAAALVLGGKLGDKFGRRAVFRTGVLLFLLFSVACALAPTLPALIALRVLQGLSAALMVPQVLAIIKASFRRKAEVATSLYGATLGMATISGMIVGGFLVGATGWRSVFVINIPICAFILAASRRGLVPESRGRVEGFDVLGPVLLASAMVTLLVSFLHHATEFAGLSNLYLGAFTIRGSGALPSTQAPDPSDRRSSGGVISVVTSVMIIVAEKS